MRRVRAVRFIAIKEISSSFSFVFIFAFLLFFYSKYLIGKYTFRLLFLFTFLFLFRILRFHKNNSYFKAFSNCQPVEGFLVNHYFWINYLNSIYLNFRRVYLVAICSKSCLMWIEIIIYSSIKLSSYAYLSWHLFVGAQLPSSWQGLRRLLFPLAQDRQL